MMISVHDIANEFGLTDKQMSEKLNLHPVMLEIGLSNYHVNEPMAQYYRQKVHKATKRERKNEKNQ